MAPDEPGKAASSDLPDAFQQAELFADLSTDELAALRPLFKRARFDPDEALFLEDAPATVFHLIDEGAVKVVQTSAEGLEVLLHVFERGGVIGALPVAGRNTYPASAIALEPVTTYFVDADTFDQIMQRFPGISRRLLRFAANMLQSAHRRLREMSTEQVERRIARTLARLASQLGREADGVLHIEASLTRQDLADMAGTSLYTVSRTLKAWERLGILQAKRKRIAILQPHRLISIAEDLPPDNA
jgi:CRP-like cAMP-binding protein